MDVEDLGRRIARRREQLGLSQTEFAARARMSEAYINRLENGGVRNPKIIHLLAVFKALDLPADAVLHSEVSNTEAELAAILARERRLAVALASLVRGLQWADPEDREFVLGHIESLARRFGQEPTSSEE
jgi:transcriptional regulator with XRE-family HTH domain